MIPYKTSKLLVIFVQRNCHKFPPLEGVESQDKSEHVFNNKLACVAEFKKVEIKFIINTNLSIETKNKEVHFYLFNPLIVANGNFRCGLCMQNLVVTDISICETPIWQAGISLIKNIYQSEVFFICESLFYTSFSYWKSDRDML